MEQPILNDNNYAVFKKAYEQEKSKCLKLEKQIAEYEEKLNSQNHKPISNEVDSEKQNKAIYLIENTPAVIYTCVASGDFKITYISKNVERMLGYQDEEVLSDPDFWFNHIHENDRNEIFMILPRLWETGQQEHEYRFLNKEGEYVWVLDTLRISYDEDKNPLEVVGSLVNITKRKALEEQLQEEKDEQGKLLEQINQTQTQLVQSEKMASLGQLAAGVAHEINNPVGFVMSNLSVLSEYFTLYHSLINKYSEIVEKYSQTSEKFAQEIKEIEKIKEDEDYLFKSDDTKMLITESMEGTERVKDIVHQLKCFSHVDQNSISEVDLNENIENTIKIVWNEIKYKAQIEKEFGELPTLKCFSAELNQVFMNMLVNAAHAIEECGLIKISTKLEDENIIICISDTGSGIDPENLKKLYDPFFTTKPVGHGTGLGLSISYGIIEKHNGKIDVESELGKGTKFTITLPVNNDIKND